jgi:hypothetical protein
MQQADLQAIIDELCHDGCKAVTQYIKEIESGSIPQQMTHLESDEKLKILMELKSIMAVYDRNNNQ